MPEVVPNLIRYESLESTNSTLKKLAESGAAEATVVVALQQTSGRGRVNRNWHSPLGGLYFSILLRPKTDGRITDFSLLTGAAMAQTVKRFFPQSIAVGVKWPNDCLLGNKKVGGVLCESIGVGHSAALIIGVGLNVNIPPSELVAFSDRPFQATSFMEASQGKVFELESVLENFLQVFFHQHEQYLSYGFSFVQNSWEKNCLLMGHKIKIRNTGLPEERELGHGYIEGTFLGIDEQGALVLSDSHGNRRSLVTGEVICCW
ncbi:MAG: biotin--[acetyl-CoA-carboxylase] ligase [Deltaproteobacteria bacterium]